MTDDMRAHPNKQTFDSDYADVDITNDLMFSTVMQDEALCIERPDQKTWRRRERDQNEACLLHFVPARI